MDKTRRQVTRGAIKMTVRLETDILSPLLDRFSLRTGVFYSGTLCGIHQFRDEATEGHLHLIKRGPVEISSKRGKPIRIIKPSLVLIPIAYAHRLVANRSRGAEVVCGTVRFGSGGLNPITEALPEVVCVELAKLPGIEALLDLLFSEAFGDQPGRRPILDRLCEVLMLRLLRHLLEQGMTRGGTLAGLADPKIAKVLAAIHGDPSRMWTLLDMARSCGMSRARFAARFHAITGQTPADYLAGWRIIVAQQMLKRGLPVKQVAIDVGYGSSSALSRAFSRKVGMGPAAWIADNTSKNV